MRIAPWFVVIPILLHAEDPAPKPGPRAVLEIRATWTVTQNGTNRTKTFTLKTPCLVHTGPNVENMVPSMAANLVPGIYSTWTATTDKDRENEMSATYSEKEGEGVRLTHNVTAHLVGGLNGSFGLAPTGKTDELVVSATSIFTGMFNGTISADGTNRAWREAAGLVYLHEDLLNPMEPSSPRARFSQKELEAGMASGKPFTLKAEKTYDLVLKEHHHRGNYTITLNVTP